MVSACCAQDSLGRRQEREKRPAAAPAPSTVLSVWYIYLDTVLLISGSCNACTLKRSITLLCIPKQSIWQNGVVP
jgi:hypothetical protein